MMGVQRSCASKMLVLLLALMVAAPMWGQGVLERDKMLRERIARNREKIATAADWHATDPQVGRLWLQVGFDYQGEMEMQQAEDAFGRGLKLLEGSSQRKDYGAGLEGLATLYLGSGRWKESEELRRKALALYEGLDDRASVARLHVGLAVDYLHEHRFAESEREAREGLEEMTAQEAVDPKTVDQSELVAGLLASGYAKCFQERCAEGLAEAQRGLGLARAEFAKDSTEMITSLLAVGFNEWTGGAAVEGEKPMVEALGLLRGKKDISYAMLVDAQLQMLKQYAVYLRETHQKRKARQMEEEIARLEGDQRAPCSGCTVSVMSLAAKR
jgi:tetratricopeptide (TPR) repeat protein